MAAEVEVKFLIDDVAALEAKLRAAGFREVTASTLEVNTLYDNAAGEIRARGEVLRIRRYGDHWKLTHKSKGSAGKHKSREEFETSVSDGEQMDAILRALGYRPLFVYEKFRAEWEGSEGHVVIDRTPIGNVGEIEGPPEWIDQTAGALGITQDKYIVKSYAGMFMEWVARTGSTAKNMTFEECGTASA